MDGGHGGDVAPKRTGPAPTADAAAACAEARRVGASSESTSAERTSASAQKRVARKSRRHTGFEKPHGSDDDEDECLEVVADAVEGHGSGSGSSGFSEAVFERECVIRVLRCALLMD